MLQPELTMRLADEHRNDLLRRADGWRVARSADRRPACAERRRGRRVLCGAARLIWHSA